MKVEGKEEREGGREWRVGWGEEGGRQDTVEDQQLHAALQSGRSTLDIQSKLTNVEISAERSVCVQVCAVCPGSPVYTSDICVASSQTLPA